jgi:dihydropyrimidinase
VGLLIQNGTLVLPDRLEIADIHVDGGKIRSVEPQIAISGLARNTEIIDASGLLVFPGFIDAHTHYGLGDGEDRTADGFFEGSRAAAFGGVTTFIDFSDQVSGLSLLDGAMRRISEAENSVIDFALHQGIYNMHDNLPRELDELKQSGISSIKLFTTYRKFGVFFDPSDWKYLFPLCRDRHLMVCIHAEDDKMISNIGRHYPEKELPPSMHPVLRPAKAELNAILKVGEAAAIHNIPLYIVHLSSEAGLDAVKAVRNRGVRVIAETTPHYLLLTKEKLDGTDGAKYLMTPPLRTARDNMALQEALKNGEIDIVATDHCSYKPSQKGRFSDCRDIPAGIPGSEEMAMLVYSRLIAGEKHGLIRMANLLSRNPAEVFGLYPEKGSLLPGTDADIVLFSGNEKGVISDKGIHSKSGYSPYSGFPYSGKPVMTILRGDIIVREGQFLSAKGKGIFLKCSDSSIYSTG